MLKKIKIKNYRGFKDHEITFKNNTVIVGKNNAGKSTLVEILRLVSIVGSRFQNLSFKSPPSWADIPVSAKGVMPSLRKTEINMATITHRYGNKPAIIDAIFESGEKIVIHISKEGIYGLIYDSNNRMVQNRREAWEVKIPSIATLPQVAPLTKNETKLNETYVKGAMSSALAPLHFRNQIYLYKDQYYEKFRKAIAETWPKIGIRSFEIPETIETDVPFMLMIREGDFSAEIGWMGHGIQIWMQMIWFIIRTEEDDTVILDEPDVYLHADLQRKLIRFLRKRKQQVIITTHSGEIITETDPEEILIMNRDGKNSRFMGDQKLYNQAISKFGNIANLDLIRLGNAKQLLIMEETNIKILKKLKDTMYPDNERPLDALPVIKIKGWKEWDEAKNTQLNLKNQRDEFINVSCVMSSELQSSSNYQKRSFDAVKRGIHLHVLKRKELENYLLIPDAIVRTLKKQINNDTKPPESINVELAMKKIISGYKEFAFTNIEKDSGVSMEEVMQAEQEAIRKVRNAWRTKEGQLELIPGKRVMEDLSVWAQKNYNAAITPLMIAKNIKKHEIHEDVVMVLEAIDV